MIVTGISRGLGEALAAMLLDRGCVVLGVGRSSSARLGGPRYRFARCDLTDIASIEDTLTAPFRVIAGEPHALVGLVNNAATAGPAGVLGALDARSLEVALKVNLIAPVAIADLFCRVFDDPKVERRVVNVSSGAAQSAIAGGGPYSIAKAGLEMLARQLVAERKDDNFCAINVRPGIIDTDMQVFMRSQRADVLPSVAMFKQFHSSGTLVAADTVAAKIVDKLLLGAIEAGRTYAYNEL